jgi:predicted transposase/invertase (TIGR01784 family)
MVVTRKASERLDRLKVKNDFIFQKIFGQNEHKEILISFLNAVLALEAEQKLTDIEIMENTRLKKDNIDDKLGILDIRARVATGEQINIEIQLVNQYNMDQRTLFYWSKLFSEQLKEGQPFQSLKKTITINILDFNFIGIDHYHSVFHLREACHPEYKLTDILEIHFLELPKFRKAKPDLGKPLDRWLVFIEDSPKEVREMAMNNDPAIAKAEELLETLGSLDEVKRYYEAREMAIHDEVTRITGARAEGLAEGRTEGEAEGIIKGKLETARNLLSMGMSIQNIAAATGLSIEQIEELEGNSRN